MSEEEWRPIEGYENLYSVSNKGQVRNDKTGRILSHNLTGKGKHHTVGLSRGAVTEKVAVHILVLKAFKGSRPKGANGLHGANGKDDNSEENLYWGSQSRNIGADRRRDGTQPSTRFSLEVAREIRELYATGQYSQQALADMYETYQSYIWRILSNKAWKESS